MLPGRKWFIRRLCQASERGIVIVNVTQCSAGMVEMERYETGYQLLQAGVVSGYDSTTESCCDEINVLTGTWIYSGRGARPDEPFDGRRDNSVNSLFVLLIEQILSEFVLRVEQIMPIFVFHRKQIKIWIH